MGRLNNASALILLCVCCTANLCYWSSPAFLQLNVMNANNENDKLLDANKENDELKNNEDDKKVKINNNTENNKNEDSKVKSNKNNIEPESKKPHDKYEYAAVDDGLGVRVTRIDKQRTNLLSRPLDKVPFRLLYNWGCGNDDPSLRKNNIPRCLSSRQEWDDFQTNCGEDRYDVYIFTAVHVFLLAIPKDESRYASCPPVEFDDGIYFQKNVKVMDPSHQATANVTIPQLISKSEFVVGDVPFSKIAGAFHRATYIEEKQNKGESETKLYSLLEKNCANFILSMLVEMDIRPTDDMIMYVARAIIKNPSKAVKEVLSKGAFGIAVRKSSGDLNLAGEMMVKKFVKTVLNDLEKDKSKRAADQAEK